MLQVEHAVQGPPAGSSGHKVPYLDVANTWSAAQVIDLGANLGTALTLRSSEPGAVGAPDLVLDRPSASPAANDVLGRIIFNGNNAALADVNYGTIRVYITDPAAATLSSVLDFQTASAGTVAGRLRVGAGVFTPSATGQDKGADTINANALYEGGVVLSSKYLALAGGTLTGDLTIAKTAPQLMFNKGASGQQNLIGGQTNGSQRWYMVLGDTAAESGASTGSNFDIFRYDNTGAFLDAPLTISRTNGGTSVIGLSVTPATGGAAINLNPATAAQQATFGFFQSGVAKWQFGKQTDDSIFLYDSVAATYVFNAPSNGTTVTFGKSALLPANSTAVTAAAGDVSTKIATTAFVSTAITNASGFANIMRRNGGLEIWQRGAGGAASFAFAASMGTQAYTADGWYTFNGAGEAMVISQVAGLVNGSQSAAKVQRNAGQTGTANIYFNFPLDTDEIYPCLGQFLLLSFTAKAGANYSQASGGLFVQIVVGTGTPARYIGTGYPSGGAFALNSGVNLTTTPQRFGLVTPAIIPVTTRQMDINFVFAPAGTAGADDSFTIDDVQLEIVPAATGYVPSNFQRLNFEEQLLLCQRHYQKTFLYNLAPAANLGFGQGELQSLAGCTGATSTYAHLRYQPQMRVTPTIVFYNPGAANNLARNASLPADCSATAGQNMNPNMLQISMTTPASTTTNHLLGVQVTADAGI